MGISHGEAEELHSSRPAEEPKAFDSSGTGSYASFEGLTVMVLDWFGGSKGQSLEELIARKKYAKAIEILRAQFQGGSRDPRMRMQLADVLVLAGKGREAVPILVGVADEFARDGFA